MARTNPETRIRLVSTAADMLRRRGLNATSIRELAKAAEAPLGSTYHYFPDGKKQVVLEALEFVGQKVSAMLQDAIQKDAVDGVQTFLGLWSGILQETEFRAGCPVISVAMEEATTEDIELMHREASNIFNRWQAILRDGFVDDGIEATQAEQLATMVVAASEGALAMCRAEKSLKPLENVTAQLLVLIRNAKGQ
ncbi:TetR/AcrR family transcriptional regulator [Litoribrevibacter euphylliae]|uniref:TetR/AcrR family transcriptional regulator n=1 Tax=Litoribrevibacter euphylliae TaxID=1834034 RepID=A0ABV7HHN9_9GAMM